MTNAFSKKLAFLSFGLILLGFATSCQRDFSNLDLPGVTPGYDTDVATFKVAAQNIQLGQVQTNGLPIYQLGKYTDAYYGEKQSYIVSQLSLSTPNPSFGVYSQAGEELGVEQNSETAIDEEETITAVYLDLPFFSNVAVDENGSPIPSDFNEDANTYELDSIYGNQLANFDISVDLLTYYLGDYEAPDFTEASTYYSSNPSIDFNNYLGQNIGSLTQIQISNEAIVIYEEDDPDTDEDESINISDILVPRLRIPLDQSFFQTNILDLEGEEVLNRDSSFKEFIRGIVINTSNFSEDLLMLLDLSQANITIEYDYLRVNTSTDEVETNSDRYTINLSGNIIQRENYTNLPNVNTNDDTDRIYLRGGQGYMTSLNLFDPTDEIDDTGAAISDGVSDDINTIRMNNWLINEANLTFFVDRETLDAVGHNNEPNRIYIFNLDDEESTPLIDYSIDNTTNTSVPYYSKNIHGGRIEKNDNGKGIQYKIRITDFINDIIRSDSTNVRLGLVVSSNINNTSTLKAIQQDATTFKYPVASIINPNSTVLYGGNVPAEDEDKRLKLEIYYTQPND